MSAGLLAWYLAIGAIFAAWNRSAHLPGAPRVAWWEWATVVLLWPVALVFWVGMVYVAFMSGRR